MKLSVGSWAFTYGPYADDPVPFDKTVERLAAAGYDGVEICGLPPHVSLEDYPTRESRLDITRLLRDNNLGVSGYAADFTFVNPVVEGNRDRYLDLVRRNVEMCVDLVSPALRVDTVAAPGSIRNRDYQVAFNRVADLWREAAEIAQQGGVRLVWEFDPGYVFNKPSEILSMHQQVAHPNFWLLFDTCHAYMCAVAGSRQHGAREVLVGGVPELLRKLDGRIGAIHVIDSDGTLYGDETSTHRPFGEGLIDFKTLTPQLLKVSGVDWWCIDLCFWEGSSKLLAPSRRFVLDLLGAKALVG
jgi:sugar phosphate isomerase/epimerase